MGKYFATASYETKDKHNMPEIRYCIVDPDTNKILDDAQGYGYKSEQNAYAAFMYRIQCGGHYTHNKNNGQNKKETFPKNTEKPIYQPTTNSNFAPKEILEGWKER